MKLNLGCGPVLLDGWENVDVNGPVVADLSVMPWPWADGSIDEIRASHLVEHLPSLIPFMNECHRVMKPGGTLTVTTPHPLCEWFWQDPTHVRGYTEHTFRCYFTEAIASYVDYGTRYWSHVEARTESVPSDPGVPEGACVVIATLVK